MMRFLKVCLCLAFAAVAPLQADTTQVVGDWDVVRVESVKTGIYVGSVTLTTSDFTRQGDQFTATYEAKVRPWFFWSETGKLTITLPLAEIARLNRGERVEFKGDATNHKNKPRHISGWAERHTEATGKIKVRIGVDDTEIVFNSTYRFINALR